MNPGLKVTMREELPYYNTALGAAETTLVVPPPFSYPGVTARIFPLRASLNILSSFCDRYLNVAPEICELRPYFPYVLLVVLDYGRMALEESNLGWVSQHEVFFEVPLGMWRRGPRGRRIFEKWVVNTPFILVDNAASLTTGRESYGWPKVLAKLQYNPESWLKDPRNPIRFLTLDVQGLNRDSLPLIDIEQMLHQNTALLPPSLELIDPFGTLSRLSRASWAIGFDLAQLLVGSPLAGFRPRQAGERREVLLDSLRRLSGFFGEPVLDVVTLKQFRDAADPTQICYQALVESQMSIARYNTGGFLGLYNLLQGDITGGFRIRLHENPAFPIVESLGLDVVKERTSGGRTVWFLEPFFPFWMSVDLTYAKGDTLCWRRRDTPWYEEDVPVCYPKRSRVAFNTVAGAAEQVWYGPFSIPEATFDVFPLRADEETLRGFIDRYLNKRDSGSDLHHFKLLGRHVYLVASSNRIFSQGRAAAWMETREISFYVPLWWHTPEGYEFAMATPFAFVDNPNLAVTMREVQGVPAMNATMEAPSRFWKKDAPRLRMKADVFTALDAGLKAEQQTVLEVDYLSMASCDPKAKPWKGSREIRRLMLKQFRDATDPERACYQALIREPWTLEEPRRITRLSQDTQVRIFRYPSLPLVAILGLDAKETLAPQAQEGTIADVLKPELPFRIELSLKIGLGEALAHTAGFLPWIPALLPKRPRTALEIQGKEIVKRGLQPLIEKFFHDHCNIKKDAGTKKEVDGDPPLETGGLQS